jgi:hypothetical protein
MRLEPPILTILAYRGVLSSSGRTRIPRGNVREGKRIDYVLVIRVIFLIIVISTVLIASAIWQRRPIAWGHERQITNGSGESRLVDISTDPSGKTVYLVWQDNRDGTVEVYYKRSLDDGITWGPDVRLSHLTPQTLDPQPRLATNGQTVLVLFSNRTSTGEHLYYVISSDRGTDFSTPIELTHDLGDQSNVALAFVGSTMHVVWQEQLNDGEEHILYANSPNAGVTWQREIDLTNATTSQDQYATITAAGSSVFVAWSRMYEGAEAIYVKASLNSGETWQPEVQVSDYEGQSFPEFPAIGSNGTYAHLVWGSVHGIQYSRSSNLGATWSTPLTLTNTTRQYVAPRIAVANSQIQVVTAGIMGVSSDVYYLSSSDAGENWNPPVSLTAHRSDAWSLAPVISTNGDSTFVAWEDNRNGRLAIFFLSRPDFAVLRNFEWQLSVTVVIILGGATIVYLGFELKRSRANARKLTRKRRFHRKHTRRGKAHAR